MKSMKKYNIGCIAAIMAVMICACSGGGRSAFDSVVAPEGELDYEAYARDAKAAGVINNSQPLPDTIENTEHQKHITQKDNEIVAGTYSNARIRVRNIGSLREIFNDSNKFHYAVAERLGIKPIHGLRDAFYTSRPIVEVKSCDLYEVDSLTHSLPYLVPEAEKLLSKIGKNFIDSLHRRGRDGYRIRVTSLLRTPASVKRLRRVNRNATDSSTHQFGTTFDLTYTRFHCLDSTKTLHDGDLKNLLAEVLLDLRNQGKCLVKFERHSACYHITATGK